MFSALHLYPVKRMSGLVVGSVIPWLEVMALQHGKNEKDAKKQVLFFNF